MEPAPTPEPTVRTEREGGVTLATPVPPSVSLGCVVETREGPTGKLVTEARDLVDEEGNVVEHDEEQHYYTDTVSVTRDVRTYDAKRRILTRAGSDRFRFGYEGSDLRVDPYDGPSAGPLLQFHLDAFDRIAERLPTDIFTRNGYLVGWLDDVRPLSFTTHTSSRTWQWDSEGFLLDTTNTFSPGVCARHLIWSKSRRSIGLSMRDAKGNTLWSGTFSFDEEGRMTSSGSQIGSSHYALAWVYADGWSVLSQGGAVTLRSSAACHFPPTRDEFATAFAGATWAPPDELRPTHLHPLPELRLPYVGCTAPE